MSARVVWIGRPPPSTIEDQLTSRNLTLEVHEADQAIGAIIGARGLVLACKGPQDPIVGAAGKRLIKQALCHGLKVAVMAEFEHFGDVEAALRTRYFDPAAEVLFTEATAGKLAEACARFPHAGGYSPTVSLEGLGSLDEEDKILLRRALSDCTKVVFAPLAGGHSAEVYLAYASLVASRAGPYPMPFFVKLDRRDKIGRELDNYRDFVANFVPFYARPNLDLRRCLLGADRGVIVGNFVEQSESLSDVVYAGRGHSALHSLFEDTLRGWRNQDTQRAGILASSPIAQSMNGTLWKRAASPLLRTYAREASQFGPLPSADKIARMLDDLPAQSHIRAISHGDLHAENVRVRSGQAIMIDFAGVQQGPLVADPANLEVSLAFDWKRESAEEAWRDAMKRLYSPTSLRRVPPPADPSLAVANLWNSIRQIRRLGLSDQRSVGEYATAVAVAMMRKAAHARAPEEDPQRRPLLVWLASNIALDLRETFNPGSKGEV